MPRIAIIHPNLGIGGAEKLVLDVGQALKSKKHTVTFFTNFYSANHCFSESKNFEIITAFSWIPDSIFGGLKAYLAFLKIFLLTFYFLIFYSKKFDLIIVDQIAVISLPFLNFFRFKTIFYCHFPDQFLTDRKNFLKKFYRVPIDFLEIFCMQYATKIIVNSKFTLSALLGFDRIQKIYKKDDTWIDVLYPCVSLNHNFCSERVFFDKKYIFVSINRFDNKKQIQRAILGLLMLKEIVDKEVFSSVHLVIMGGCDPLRCSDIKYFNELVSLASKFGLYKEDSEESKISFLKNPDDETKFSILKKATALIYTPDNEHFGIVPLESMIMGVPVLASASGGPLETIVHDVTGIHLNYFPNDLAKAMKFLIENPEKRDEMGEAAKVHCVKNFSFKIFENNLEMMIENVI